MPERTGEESKKPSALDFIRKTITDTLKKLHQSDATKDQYIIVPESIKLEILKELSGAVNEGVTINPKQESFIKKQVSSLVEERSKTPVDMQSINTQIAVLATYINSCH